MRLLLLTLIGLGALLAYGWRRPAWSLITRVIRRQEDAEPEAWEIEAARRRHALGHVTRLDALRQVSRSKCDR